jgi:hypothetical protein
MTMQAVQQTPANDSTAPPADPDAAAYAALAKELEIEQEGAEPAAEPAESAATEPAEPTEPAGKPAPTELDNLRSALKEAREAHKADMAREQARTDNILQALREAKERRGQQQEQKPAEAPQLPDVQSDPIGHFTGRIAQLEQALQYAYQGGQQQTQQITEHLQEQAMWGTIQASEAAIRDPKSPDHKADYDDAVAHLIGVRARQLDEFYPNESPAVIAAARQAGFGTALEYKQALLQNEARSLAQTALQNGSKPALMFYNLALTSGYQPKANGKAPAPAASLTERAKQQIEAAKKGTKATVTLSGGSASRKGADDMTQDDLARLFLDDPETADKIFEEMGRAGKL